MLPRRHIRIKVFQTLYANSQHAKDSNFNVKKEFNKNLKGYLNLHKIIINFLIEFKEVAISHINIRKAQMIRLNKELKPNTKFIENIFIKQLKGKKKIQIEDHRINTIVKKEFKKLQKSKYYIKYMDQSVKSNAEDKKMILYLIKKHIIINEKIHDLIEDYSIYWNDDILLIYNFLIEQINNNQSINHIKIFRKKEDEEFSHLLLKTTIIKEEEVTQIIYDLVKNWDEERIAISDLILMQMAISEIKYIPNIPHNVTLDEYIEISKEYSSPKSKEFINGILDVFIKEILTRK